MARKLASAFLMFVCFLTKIHALSVSELPYDMNLTHRWTNTTSFEIETENHKVGTLYRRIIDNTLQYDLYDHDNYLLTSTQTQFFPIKEYSRHTRFDVYNKNECIMGAMDEQLFPFLPEFTIYSPEGIKLAHGERNFWNTIINVYDVLTDTKIATMSRPFFEKEISWNIRLKHKEPLLERNIDPNLFLTALAMQADNEYRREQQRPEKDKQQNRMNSILSQKNEEYANRTHLHQVHLLSEPELETLAAHLEREYELQADLITTSSNTSKKADAFVAYCLELANSPQTNISTRKAILHLLKQHDHLPELDQ
tara:strand:+ start:2774 stop:3703 length:930 start_codon:yes stop_codon:yes gene_type:complete